MVVLAVLPIFLRSTAQGFLHEVCSGRRHRSSGGEEAWETALVHACGMSSLVTACNNTGTTCNDDSNSCGRIVYHVLVEACTRGIDKVNDVAWLLVRQADAHPADLWAVTCRDALGKKSLQRSSVPVTGLPEASALCW